VLGTDMQMSQAGKLEKKPPCGFTEPKSWKMTTQNKGAACVVTMGQNVATRGHSGVSLQSMEAVEYSVTLRQKDIREPSGQAQWQQRRLGMQNDLCGES
jgi:hypothetical protein